MDDPKVRRYSGVYMRKEGNSRDSAAMGVDLDCGAPRTSATRKKAG